MKPNSNWARIVCVVALVIAGLSPVSGCRGKKASADVAPSAGWFEDLRGRIQSDFDQPEQVAALLGVVDQMESTMADLDREVVAYYTKIGALDREYATTREEFQAVIDEFNATQRRVFEEMLVHVGELKRIAGPEGWRKLSDIDETLYESWQRDL